MRTINVMAAKTAKVPMIPAYIPLFRNIPNVFSKNTLDNNYISLLLIIDYALSLEPIDANKRQY
jgi:hypothetical protein